MIDLYMEDEGYIGTYPGNTTEEAVLHWMTQGLSLAEHHSIKIGPPPTYWGKVIYAKQDKKIFQ